MKDFVATIVSACAVTILFAGCYTNSLLSVDEIKGDQAYQDFKDINGVVTKDGTKYDLYDTYLHKRAEISDSAAEVTAVDSLVGESRGARIALPLSDVDRVSVKEFDPAFTVVSVVGSAALVGLVVAAVSDISQGWINLSGGF